MEALIEARIERAVVAIEDPNPVVSGQGLSACVMPVLRWSWVFVEQVEQDLRGLHAHASRLWPRHLKLATSLDGRTAMASGESQWITGSSARRTCSDCVRKRTLL